MMRRLTPEEREVARQQERFVQLGQQLVKARAELRNLLEAFQAGDADRPAINEQHAKAKRASRALTRLDADPHAIIRNWEICVDITGEADGGFTFKNYLQGLFFDVTGTRDGGHFFEGV